MRSWIARLAALFTVGCAAIPQLQYDADDGGSAPVADSGTDARTNDAATDGAGSGSDSGTAACTPTSLPAGATTCCNGTPCVGHAGTQCTCSDCEQAPCGAQGKWCCDTPHGVTCKPNGNGC